MHEFGTMEYVKAQFTPSKQAIVALFIALAGFVVYFGSSGESTVNGVVTSSYDYNYAAIVLGLAAVGLAVREGVRALRAAAADKRPVLTIPVAFLAGVIAVGVYQVLSGADIL